VDKLIRLLPKEELGRDNANFINVSKSPAYTDNLRGYFFRSRSGIFAVVNDNYGAEEQAKAIMQIKRGLQKCKTAEMGLVDGDGVYHCGGSLCCLNRNKDIKIESE